MKSGKGYDNAKPYAAFVTKNLGEQETGIYNAELWPCFQGTESGQEQKRSDS